MAKKCSGYLVGISKADLRHACTCHWMEKIYSQSVYYEKDEPKP